MEPQKKTNGGINPSSLKLHSVFMGLWYMRECMECE